jgi:enamine deaminase RidA (YjgF/YER057c/UK114 family)
MTGATSDRGVVAYRSPYAPPPAGTYSQATSGSGLVFLSGQTARYADGTRAHDVPLATEAEMVMQNLEHAARAAGCELSDALKVTVYLRHPSQDRQIFDEVYRRHVREPFPARSTVQSDLPDSNIEVDAILTQPGTR